MVKVIKFGLVVFTLFCCILLVQCYVFAEGIDISIRKVIAPSKIYFGKKTAIEIVLLNSSDVDLSGCMFSVEIDDGSKASQPLLLRKKASEKVVLNWVPQRQGKLELTALILSPPGSQEENTENNQVTKSITVLSLEPTAKRKRN